MNDDYDLSQPTSMLGMKIQAGVFVEIHMGNMVKWLKVIVRHVARITQISSVEGLGELL